MPGQDLIDILEPQIARGIIKLSILYFIILDNRPLTIADINAIKSLNFAPVVVL